MSKKPIITALFFVIMITSCGKKPNPKPYEYFRIDLPEHSYKMVDTIKNYDFEISEYAEITPYIGESKGLNIDYNQLNGRIHITFMPIDLDSFRIVTEDSRRLAYKHTIKANAIIENYYANDTTKVYGVLYKITGNAASPVQFFITDSTKHFLRGALYFNNLPNYDSIAPVADYINEDIIHLIETVRWK
jgi:gliding motility-associated lipoprotein GldD